MRTLQLLTNFLTALRDHSLSQLNLFKVGAAGYSPFSPLGQMNISIISYFYPESTPS
jgi:hypothetical protein